MKKIFLMFAAVAATLGLASCNETWDDAATLKTHEGTPTIEFLNTPILQEQVLMITEANKDGSVHMTCSQPDYGYAAVATYKVQVSLENDFTDPEKFVEITQNFFDCAQINPTNADVAAAIEKLAGVKTEDDLPLPYQKVYMRLRAFVAQNEAQTTYFSNTVWFDQISADYLAIWVSDVPVDLYLRGGFNDWGTGSAWQFVTYTEENSWICRNVTIDKDVSIKVSTSTWSSPNLGGNAGENDDSQKITTNEEYAMTGGDNPGHMRLDKDFHGDVVLRLTEGVYYIIFAETAE
ncbi:MAG: SusE domain-containing protein [Muribaculaceae bacterium]|nr:SusE domain-containing protein [Muribaculaceae bacterium]